MKGFNYPTATIVFPILEPTAPIVGSRVFLLSNLNIFNLSAFMLIFLFEFSFFSSSRKQDKLFGMKYHNGVVLGNRVRVGPIRKKSEEEKRKKNFIERRVCRIESRRRYNPPTTTTTSCSNNGDVGLFLSHACSMRSLLFGWVYISFVFLLLIFSQRLASCYFYTFDRPTGTNVVFTFHGCGTDRAALQTTHTFFYLRVLGTFFYFFLVLYTTNSKSQP